MSEQEKNCYLGINGKKYGPVSEMDILRLYAQKKITGEAKFIRAGGKEWVALAKSGIIPSAAPIDDGLPPLPADDDDDDDAVNQPNYGRKFKLKVAAITLGVMVAGIGIVIAIGTITGNNNSRTNYIAQTPSNTIAQQNSRPSQAPGTSSAHSGTMPSEQRKRSHWTIENMTDVFGDDTDVQYLRGIFSGGTLLSRNGVTGSLNVAVTVMTVDADSELGRLGIPALFILDIEVVGAFGIPGMESPREAFGVEHRTMQTKVDGSVSEFSIHGFQGSPDSEWQIMTPYNEFFNYLYDGKEISCAIEMRGATYNFKIDGSDFTPLWKELGGALPANGNDLDLEAAYSEVISEVLNRPLDDPIYFGYYSGVQYGKSDVYYAFCDIDGNGVNELIFLGVDGSAIIYTLSDGKKVLLLELEGGRVESFGGINELGYIIVHHSQGASVFTQSYYKIAKEGENVTDFGFYSDTFFSENADDWYFSIRDLSGGRKVTEAEFDAYRRTLDAPVIQLDWKRLSDASQSQASSPDSTPSATQLNIVGIWTQTIAGITQYIEFYKDGTCVYTDNATRISESGRYEVSGDTLTRTRDRDGSQSEYTIIGNEFYLIGGSTPWRRVG